ncbi:TonB-dependent receptor [Avibacterium paragallinarum]|uniref:TonB-dependent receptor n=1 Tax=Avibacterium paragallinarum TaxID=728 RepID=A0ABU7QH76_AVIPA|nr:TonB-dependent receptor [Avibacterium paragallinarum]MEE3608661.1 TonB-dependent receptor [Avibacterium paragallinarum]MEE3621974.1 TonB-dependent receptor [Avibacterium paragallinarum]MEE3668879.1 TonB-dependent receptor [Avibacterium paragallinarum]MEE3680449.1 TonB-dependent receptor [Avibacterium paragallinarum]MEE4385694.1 TonB-dependent receptor [Avibacterium paragallinarum]
MKINTALLLSLATSLTSGTVFAETKLENNSSTTEGEELEPIFVYSRGVRESRLDTPFAVDVIDKQDIKVKDTQNVLEALSSLPSLNIHNGNNAATTSVWIRGVGSLTNTSMDDNSVDIVVDGISNGKSGLARPLLDVERIEVAKGPQGTLFGTKAEAGSVMIKTTDPKQEFEANIGVNAGNLNLRGINGLLNVPFSEQFSFRLATQLERFDDYIKDADTGKPLNRKTNEAIQAKLRWNDGEYNDAILSVYHDQRKNFLPIILSEPFSFSTQTNGLPHSAYRKNSGISLKYMHGFDFAVLESTTAYHYHRANVNRPLRPLDMLGVFYNAANIPQSLHPILDQYYYQNKNNRQNVNERVKQFSQELKFTSETNSGLIWVAGAYFEKRKRNFTYDAIRSTQQLSPAVLLGNDPFNAIIDRDFDYETKALFGELTFPLTESLKAVAGARYSHEQLNYRAIYMPNADLAKPSYTEKHKISDNFLSGRLGVNYALTSEWRLYAIQSLGNKFGGFADYGTNIAYGKDNQPYKSAKVISSEIGSKFLTNNGKFGFDVSLFNTKVKNDHITITLYPSYLTGTANADTRSRGAELGIYWQLAEQLKLKQEITYLDTKVTKVPATARNITAKGNRLPQAAKWSGALSIAYESKPFNFGFMGESQLLSDLSIRYVGSRYAQPDNVQKLGHYMLLNLSIGLQNKHHNILLWSKNLTNRKYHAFGIMPGYAGLPSSGRTFGVNYSYAF